MTLACLVFTWRSCIDSVGDEVSQVWLLIGDNVIVVTNFYDLSGLSSADGAGVRERGGNAALSLLWRETGDED